MMGKMGLGLLGFVGKSLLSGGGAAGSVLSAVGKGCAGGAGKGGGGSSVLSLLGGKSGGGQGCGGGRRVGGGRGRNQNAAPKRLLPPCWTKTRLQLNAAGKPPPRPELAPFTPVLIKSSTQVREKPRYRRRPADARREAALEAPAAYRVALRTARLGGTQWLPLLNRLSCAACPALSKRGSLLR